MLSILGIVLGVLAGWTTLVALPIALVLGRATRDADQAEQPTVPDYVPAEWSQL